MVEYTTCLDHPWVILPVALREAERHFCYDCAQEGRRETYAKQKEEATLLRSKGDGTLHLFCDNPPDSSTAPA